MNNQPVEVDPGQRVIVNSDYNTSNVANMDDMLDHIIETLDRCIDILSSHCGPHAGYAMLVNSMNINQSFEPNIFTRDGIRILSSVEFMSPLEKYIKDMLTYVGARVDNKAKDGTTTSMLFSAMFLKNLLMQKKTISSFKVSMFDCKQCVDEVFSTVLKYLDDYTYRVEDFTDVKDDTSEASLMSAAGNIAFIQAMSSSGGNVELATAMREIFSKSPKVSWEFITSHNSVKETGPNFSVEVDEYDSRIRCIQATDQGLNYALNTQYIEEDVKLLVYPSTLDDMSLDTDVVNNYLDTIPSDQPFCIITQHIAPRLTVKINQLNQLRHKPIVVWQYSPEHKLAGQNYPWELLLLCAISGTEPLTHSNKHQIEDTDIIHAKRVHWHDTFLDIFDVIEMDKDSCLHPYYADSSKATKFYTSVREAIETQIGIYKDGKNPDGTMLSIFIEMLNRLATVHRPTLKCGGPVHEQVLNKDVVQDVQGAIMSSLNNGFTINGTLSLLSASHKAQNEIDQIEPTYDTITNEPNNKDKLEKIIINALTTALKDITKLLFGNGKEFTILKKSDITNMESDNSLYANIFAPGKVWNIDSYLAYIRDPEYPVKDAMWYPVTQPVDIIKELLKRTGELLMKFVNTDKIIIYGGVVINKQEGE